MPGRAVNPVIILWRLCLVKREETPRVQERHNTPPISLPVSLEPFPSSDLLSQVSMRASPALAQVAVLQLHESEEELSAVPPLGMGPGVMLLLPCAKRPGRGMPGMKWRYPRGSLNRRLHAQSIGCATALNAAHTAT
jgi:hypothetical protein